MKKRNERWAELADEATKVLPLIIFFSFLFGILKVFGMDRVVWDENEVGWQKKKLDWKKTKMAPESPDWKKIIVRKDIYIPLIILGIILIGLFTLWVLSLNSGVVNENVQPEITYALTNLSTMQALTKWLPLIGLVMAMAFMLKIFFKMGDLYK